MNQKVEDLRRKAFVIYGGMEGVDRVNWEVKNIGVKEDSLLPDSERKLLNAIIKNVFIEYVGLERTKGILATQVAHVRGYDRQTGSEWFQVRFLSKTSFLKIILILAALFILTMVGLFAYYIITFDQVDRCQNNTDPSMKDHCFTLVALQTNNLSLCDELSTRSKKYTCIENVGIGLNDSNICDTIPKEDPETVDLYERCISCVAFKLKSVEKCRMHQSELRRDECISQISRGRSLIC